MKASKYLLACGEWPEWIQMGFSSRAEAEETVGQNPDEEAVGQNPDEEISQ